MEKEKPGNAEQELVEMSWNLAWTPDCNKTVIENRIKTGIVSGAWLPELNQD